MKEDLLLSEIAKNLIISNLKKQAHLTLEEYGFFVKVFVYSFKERIKNLIFQRKAEKERYALNFLRNHELYAPKWISNFPLNKNIEICVTELIDGKPITYLSNNKIVEVIPTVAKTIRKLHELGFFHKDLHPGNILYSSGKIYLTDFHRHRFYKNGVPLSKKLWDIACFLWPFQSEEINRLFILNYAETENIDSYFLELKKYFKKIVRREIKKIKRDALRNSLYFKKENLQNLCFFMSKDTNKNLVFSILEKHEKIKSGKTQKLVKETSRKIITSYKTSEGIFYIKEYRLSGFFEKLKERLRFPKFRKAWINANILYFIFNSNTKPIALVEQKRCLFYTKAYLVFFTPSNVNELHIFLNDIIQQDQKTKNNFLKAFVKFLITIKEFDLCHKDFKINHILVLKEKNHWSFSLIDTEDIFFKKWNFNYIKKMLTQMYHTFPFKNSNRFFYLRFLCLFLKSFSQKERKKIKYTLVKTK